MKMFPLMKDVYFSALRLQTALEDILASSGYRDIDAHRRGECRCKRPAPGGSDASTGGADYMADLLKLRDDIEDFGFAFAEAMPRLTGEISFGVYRVAATVDGLRGVVVQAEADLAAPRKKCAGEALVRIEERCELLQTRAAELNIMLGAPDALGVA